ncbi:hypothetical protein T12_12331, partial [Trichinella patagoniensis]
LSPPYSGPHRVLGRSDKVLTIDNEGVISAADMDRVNEISPAENEEEEN